ncbi:MAG: ATP-dependent DNA helicase RecG [Bacillota bacterium]
MNKVEVMKLDSIRFLKGVGEARAKLFEKLGILFVQDLVTFYPRQYEDRNNIKKISDIEDGEVCGIRARVIMPVMENRPRRNLTISKAKVSDGSGSVVITWFNQNYIKNSILQNEDYIFFGKVSVRLGLSEMQNPVSERVSETMNNTCRIIPVYPSTAGLTQGIIRKAIKTALDLTNNSIPEIFSSEIRKEYKLAEINYSVQNIHFPESDEAFLLARKRLVFEELYLLQVGLLKLKHNLNESTEFIAFDGNVKDENIFSKFPFSLTGAQDRVWNEVKKDMEADKVMSRLVQGDVGSGKTAIAMLAVHKSVRSGFQAALMAPTEILANQHFQSFSEIFEKLGVKIGFLKGNMKKSEKNATLEQIARGEIELIIGTHALIQDDVEFANLGLVITDEQHRFGVEQRGLLSKKAKCPDVLVLTATPIPRTLALILYGDLDISIIDELPPGRKPIRTKFIGKTRRPKVLEFIKEQVREGRQAFIVCPLIEESDAIEAKSATETAIQIAENDLVGLRVGLMHGRLKSAEKADIMKRFAAGEIDVLVSTTVIEVGINVPNATIMMIENAERFGLAQLHQLRGRVGRGEHESWCILCNYSESAIARERMKVMEASNDGFVISEKDLELRGPGEFFGTRQHGIPELKIANLYRDVDVLKQAQVLAREHIESIKFIN